MPTFASTLSIKDASNKVSYNFSERSGYQQLFQIEKTLDDTDNPATQSLIDLVPGSKGGAQLEDIEFLCVYNKGVGTAEIRVKYGDMNDDSGQDITSTSPALISYLLRPSEYMVFPNIWGCSYSSASQGAANTTVSADDNSVISGALTRNAQRVGADILLAEALDGTETGIDVDDGDFFVPGDLIQVGTEVMRVDSIDSNTLTVERGVYGSTAASHSDNANILFPYFNAYHDYDRFSKPQTDQNGNYKSFNFFGGRGRTNGSASSYGAPGVCRGTVALKFYEAGFIEFGLSNVRASEDSGLSANTAYAFDLILNEVVEKGSVTAKGTIAFTTDSSDTTWGSASKGGSGVGVLQKIKNAMDAKFNDITDALHGLGAEIEIIDGDIRITSHSRLSNSRVGLSVAASGTTVFGVGNFPGVNSSAILCEGKVIGSSTNQVTYGDAARLPSDTYRKDGLTLKNSGAFMIDNGFGRLIPGGGNYNDNAGAFPSREKAASSHYNIGGVSGRGTIDYVSGEINIINGPRNAEFVISGIYATGIGTGGGSASNGILHYVYARSITKKVESKVQLVAFGR
tara:strand:- start:78 stop:1787 length:1710 start_codon:yes stop_codon:yes gene_type:complete